MIRFLDGLNSYIGYYSAFLILPLVGVVTYEVMMRYALNAPTTWGFETTVLIYGMHYMLVMGDTHRNNIHVSIDVIEANLAQRTRLILRIITNLVLFLPTMGLLAIWSVRYAMTSWQQWELASTSWAPPLYPFKTLMAIGFVLLWLQGIAHLLRDFSALFQDKTH